MYRFAYSFNRMNSSTAIMKQITNAVYLDTELFACSKTSAFQIFCKTTCTSKKN